MVEELQFDKEEIVTNVGPLETLNLEQKAEEVISTINPITLDKLVMVITILLKEELGT